MTLHYSLNPRPTDDRIRPEKVKEFSVDESGVGVGPGGVGVGQGGGREAHLVYGMKELAHLTSPVKHKQFQGSFSDTVVPAFVLE